MYKITKEKQFDVIFIKQKNIKVWLLNYGATIKQIQTPNIEGCFEDVLLEYQNIDDYLNNNIYLNATIGPIAGRIKNGLIHLNDQDIVLHRNQNNQHTLHSANLALSYKRFTYDIDDQKDETIVKMSYKESFQSIVYKITVSYTIKNSSILIDYDVISNHDFVFSLTNHAYVNLSGNLKNNIKNHLVKINTSQRHQLDIDQISTHQIIEDDLYDFTTEKSLFEPLKMLKNHPYKGFDDIYLFKKDHSLDLMATVKSPSSKRMLSIYSTYDHMVFYTHNNTNHSPLKHLLNHPMHYGLCFECQKAPYGFNQDAYLEKNKTYKESILLAFNVY